MSEASASPNLSLGSDSEEEEYVVEAIREWRYNLREKRFEYLIKWKNYNEDDNTWEPKENLTNCPEKLKIFEKNMSKKDKRFYTVARPKSLTGFQRRAQFVKCIGADGPHDSDTEESSTKPDKQRFYCLLMFEDSDYAEEVTVKQFYKYRPDDAFEFFEQRLLGRSKTK